MGGCAALNCSNHSRNKFRMFRFPTDPVRRQKWVDNCKREDWVPGPRAELCSVHFEEAQYEQRRQDNLKKLKPNAVPTLFNFDNPLAKVIHRKIKGKVRKRKPSPEISSVYPEVHFEEGQFELKRADGWRKLKPNAIPTNFPEPSTVEKIKLKRKRARSVDSDGFEICDVKPAKRKSKKKGGKQESTAKNKRKAASKKEESSPQNEKSSKRPKLRPKRASTAPVIYDSDTEVDESEDEKSEVEEKQIAHLKRENEIMRQEIQEFEKHNKAMTRVIAELEKHNKAMAFRLQELDKENKMMNVKLLDLEKQNEDLRSKLNCCFSEEQYQRMEKLVGLGKIERYIPPPKNT